MVSPATLHWVCSVPLGIIFSIFGLIGNALSILVWRRIMKKKISSNSSTSIYLIGLAIIDSGLLLFFLLTDTLHMNSPHIKKTYSYSGFFSYFGFPMFFFFVVASIWMVVGVTVNRFIMVKFPLKAKVFCSNVRTYISIGIILVLCFIINVPHFFSYHVVEKYDLINGTMAAKYYTFDLTDYGKQGGAQRYEFWVHCIFLVLAPWFSVATLNGFIINALLARSKNKTRLDGKKKSDGNSHDRQMTVVLLTITFSFLVLLAWQCITQCFWMLKVGQKGGNVSPTWNIVDASFAFAKLGVVINSSINCILYCFAGTTFRRELVKIFRRQGDAYKTSFSSGTTKETSQSYSESKI